MTDTELREHYAKVFPLCAEKILDRSYCYPGIFKAVLAQYPDARDQIDVWTPELAFEFAYWADREGRDDTRVEACKDIQHAYNYAFYVDEGPHEVTRAAMREDPYYAPLYAYYVDGGELTLEF